MRFTAKTEQIPRCIDEIEAHHDLPSMEYRGTCVAQRNGTTPSRRSPDLGEAEFRARWEQIQGRQRREKELEASANWAFGLPAPQQGEGRGSQLTRAMLLNSSRLDRLRSSIQYNYSIEHCPI